MLIDLHAHSSGISHCCRIPIEQVIDVAKDIGIDGIVLTNHYQSAYVRDGDCAALAKRYVEEYERAKQYGDKVGFRVFFGIEVTMEKHGGVHLLVYGVDTGFIEEHPAMFSYSHEELYRLVKEKGGVLVQAHPFRGNVDRLLDVSLLDGVEISCHPLYEGTHYDELAAVAARHGLFLTCGGDYHADTHRAHCGVYLPDTVGNGQELAAYLAAADTVELCVQEVTDDRSRDVKFFCNKR